MKCTMKSKDDDGVRLGGLKLGDNFVRSKTPPTVICKRGYCSDQKIKVIDEEDGSTVLDDPNTRVFPVKAVGFDPETGAVIFDFI